MCLISACLHKDIFLCKKYAENMQKIYKISLIFIEILVYLKEYNLK